MTAITRMQREVRMLASDPPPGVWAAPKEDKLTELEAQIQGPSGSVYEGGVFKLSVDIPVRYPIEPPKVRFVTRVYHPNIDPEGRICLDILNPPPKGAWKPSLNVSTVLASIGLLLADPNPDDGLVAETSQEFKHQRSVFDAKARQWTKLYAMSPPQEERTEQTAAAVEPEGKDATDEKDASRPRDNPSSIQQRQEEQDDETPSRRVVLSPMKDKLNTNINQVEGESKQLELQDKSTIDEVPQKRSKLSLKK